MDTLGLLTPHFDTLTYPVTGALVPTDLPIGEHRLEPGTESALPADSWLPEGRKRAASEAHMPISCIEACSEQPFHFSWRREGERVQRGLGCYYSRGLPPQGRKH